MQLAEIACIVLFVVIAIEATVFSCRYRKVARELYHSKERYRKAVVASRVGLWDWEVKENRFYVTMPLQELFGLGSKLPSDMHEWFERIHPEDRQRAREDLERHLRGVKDEYSVEYRLLRDDRSFLDVLCRATTTRNERGEAIRMLGAVTCITDRKRMESELHKAKEEAETADRAKSEFLANMSHEIRTPMTAIMGFCELLIGEKDSDLPEEERTEAVLTIHRNAQYLLDIINDMLDLSKIEAGKVEVEALQCCPRQIITDVASLMRVRAAAKGLPLKAEYEGPIPLLVRTDPTRLRQILINLVGNAIKFTEIGCVRLVTRLIPDSADSPRLQFDVIDTGIGMTNEQIGRLFQPFVQADASTTRKFGGTGLGLTISKRLAEMLGGELNVHSELGEGSTFRLTIRTGSLEHVPMEERPLELSQTFRKAEMAREVAPRLDCRILLAEDGPDNRRLISFVLRKAGAEVFVAENGKTAMEMALAAFPGWGRRSGDLHIVFDVILMDMQMPVMDGYTAAQRLRDEGYTRPIIALTANAMSGDREKCLAAGCDDFATKPIDRAKLIAMIQKYVDQGQTTDSDQPAGSDAATAEGRHLACRS